MSPRRLPVAARAIIVLVIVAGIAVLYAKKVERGMPDYEVYRRAAARAARAEPLYRPDDGHYQFNYLPAFAVATLPVGLGHERVVRACWFAVTMLLLVVLLRTTVVALPEMRRSRAALIGATFVLLAKFYAHEIELGQVNILMTTLVVLAVVQIRANREIGAGLLIAAAVVVKPYAVLLVPYLAARRRVGSLVGMAIGLGAALMLPALLYGFAGNLQLLGEWWRTVTETDRAESDGLQQRLGRVGVCKMARARPDRSGTRDSHGRRPPGRRSGGVRNARAGRRSRAAGGRSASDVDAIDLTAGVGLRLPALDAGGDVAGQLFRSAAAVHSGARDRCPSHRRLQHLRPRLGGPPTSSSCACR